ncbi:MAG TPA: hypothetical protein PLB52_02560 [Candidatus Moranbacteria bacterium]|nr:hypothetical protein [Candidatus Moranbacteria bacterium]
MKQLILKYSLYGATLLTGFFSWYFLFHSMDYSGMQVWLIPAACFSLYIISLSLMAILIKQEIAFEFVVIFSLFFTLIFTFSKWHFLILILGSILVLSALRLIRKDLDMNIKIDFWKSLYVGRFRMVIGLALIISSQYFFMISQSGKEQAIPEFDTAPITRKIIEPIMVLVNPDFKAMQKEGLTVDQFIIESKQEKEEDIFSKENIDDEIEKQIPANLPAEKREAMKQEALQQISDSQKNISQKNQELVLKEGREQLAKMVGRKVSGEEEISEVFAGFIDKKINDYFQPHKVDSDKKSPLFYYILSAVLFLTIWPMGSALSLIWFGIVIIIFKLMVHFKLVEIKTVTVQREMIV